MQEEKSSQLTEELTSKKDENSKIIQDQNDLKSEMDELISQHSSLEAKYAALQSSNAALQEHLNRERGDVEILRKELETVKEKYEIASLEKNKLSSNLDKYLEKVNECDSMLSALREEKRAAGERIQSLESNLDSSRSQNEELLKAVHELETDFDAKVETSNLVQELREKLKKTEDEVSEKKQVRVTLKDSVAFFFFSF